MRGMMGVDAVYRERVEEEVGYNWDELNKLAKQLERDIDVQFSSFGSDSWTALTTKTHLDQEQLNTLESSLRRLSSVIDMMNELLQQIGTGKPNSSSTHLFNRHQELYQEFMQDLRKLRVHNQSCTPVFFNA